MIKLMQLCILIPLFNAIFTAGIAFLNLKVARFLQLIVSFLAFIVTIYLAINLDINVDYELVFSGFREPFGIKFSLNKNNVILVLLIQAIAFIYSFFLYEYIAYNSTRAPFLIALSFAFVVANIGLVLSQDFFNIYVFIELGGIASYALLSYKGSSASFSALRYLLAGSVAATFLLLGIFCFYAKSGTLVLSDSLLLLEGASANSIIVIAASVFCFSALLLKAGVFPLHFWLPAAYGATHPIIALIVASLATKISLYVLFALFTPLIVVISNNANLFVELVLSAAIVYSVIRAFFETRLSYIISYIVVAEIVYIFAGVFFQNAPGTFAASYHLIADGLITAFAFGLIYQHSNVGREVYLSDLRGLKDNKLGLYVLWLYLGACFVGLPLTPGFITKVSLIKASVLSQNYLLLISFIISSLVIVATFFRIIFYATKSSNINKAYPYNDLAIKIALSLLFAFIFTYSLIPKFVPNNIFIK